MCLNPSILLIILISGFYRVNYDDGTWQNIGKALKSPNHSNIHVLNRAQVNQSINIESFQSKTYETFAYTYIDS